MRRTLIPLVVAALALPGPLASIASAGSQRHDVYYQVRCITPTGQHVQPESVDAHAIQFDKTPGGKDGAILNFNANHPGWDCKAFGPFNA